MNQHPILFSTPMVQAILEGRKTQTMRIVKGINIGENSNDTVNYSMKSAMGTNIEKERLGECFFGIGDYCPYGKVGDVLWVRETFGTGGYFKTGWNYKASDELPKYEKWKPSIHMPKSACRIWLQITNIRVERLHDISEADAVAEGINTSKISGDYNHTPVQEFQDLWNSINGKESWDSNPWLWVLEFNRIEKPTG
jgi:hypothetical protein